MIVFEDLHWADSASVEVHRLPRPATSATSPVLLIGTYRSDELDADPAVSRRMLAELGRHRAVSRASSSPASTGTRCGV